MPRTKTVESDLAQAAPKDAITLMKADHKDVNRMFAAYAHTHAGPDNKSLVAVNPQGNPMNPTPPSDALSDVPWLTSDRRVPVPRTSLLPESETPPTAGANVTAQVPSHDTVDAWVDDMRATVRRQPLASAACALVLGAVISRLAR